MSIERSSEPLAKEVTRRDVLKWGMRGLGTALIPELAGCEDSKEPIKKAGYYELPKGLNVKIFTFDPNQPLKQDVLSTVKASTQGIKETTLQDSTEGIELTSVDNPYPAIQQVKDAMLSTVNVEKGDIFNVASPKMREHAAKIITDKDAALAFFNERDHLENELLKKYDPKTFNKLQKDGELEKDISVYIVVPME